MNPEFVDAIHNIIPTDAKIENETVYPIMVEIYKQKLMLRRQYGQKDHRVKFDFKLGRAAIKSIEGKLNIPETDRINNILP